MDPWAPEIKAIGMFLVVEGILATIYGGIRVTLGQMAASALGTQDIDIIAYVVLASGAAATLMGFLFYFLGSNREG